MLDTVCQSACMSVALEHPAKAFGRNEAREKLFDTKIYNIQSM